MITFINRSTNNYYVAATKATAEGFKLGSSSWWSALQYHKQYPERFESENGCTIEDFLKQENHHG